MSSEISFSLLLNPFSSESAPFLSGLFAVDVPHQQQVSKHLHKVKFSEQVSSLPKDCNETLNYSTWPRIGWHVHPDQIIAKSRDHMTGLARPGFCAHPCLDLKRRA